jgi:hypothetical protein
MLRELLEYHNHPSEHLTTGDRQLSQGVKFPFLQIQRYRSDFPWTTLGSYPGNDMVSKPATHENRFPPTARPPPDWSGRPSIESVDAALGRLDMDVLIGCVTIIVREEYDRARSNEQGVYPLASHPGTVTRASHDGNSKRRL